MRKFLIYFPIIFLAIVLQSTFVPVVFENPWLPDIVLMMVLVWALIDGFEGFLPWAVFIGILYDLSLSVPVGTSAIVFSLVAYGVGFFSRRISVEMRGVGFLLSLFFILSSTVGAKIIISFFWIKEFFLRDGLVGAVFLGKILAVAFFWNTAFFFGWFFAINKLEEFFYFKRKEEIKI